MNKDPDFRPYILPRWEYKCIECCCPNFDYTCEDCIPHCFLGRYDDNEQCPINGLTGGDMFTYLRGV